MSENGPEFFKVYMPGLNCQRLRIPPAFIKNFNGYMPKKVTLKNLSGTLWHVELKKVKKNWFIQNGWQDFVTDNSLEFGDFLIFSYNRNSVFDVTLFGKDGCMKENDISSVMIVVTDVNEEQGHEAVQTDCRFLRACKRKSSEPLGIKNICESPDVRQCKSSRIAAINVEKHTVLNEEKFVMPKNPHFVTFIRRCNHNHMPIPSKALKKYGIILKPDVGIRDQSGKLWPIKITIWKDGRSNFSTGWFDFWKHMKLQVKDMCLFEFILERGKNICKEMRVHVYPAKRKKSENFRSGTSRQRR